MYSRFRAKVPKGEHYFHGFSDILQVLFVIFLINLFNLCIILAFFVMISETSWGWSFLRFLLIVFISAVLLDPSLCPPCPLSNFWVLFSPVRCCCHGSFETLWWTRRVNHSYTYKDRDSTWFGETCHWHELDIRVTFHFVSLGEATCLWSRASLDNSLETSF